MKSRERKSPSQNIEKNKLLENSEWTKTRLGTVTLRTISRTGTRERRGCQKRGGGGRKGRERARETYTQQRRSVNAQENGEERIQSKKNKEHDKKCEKQVGTKKVTHVDQKKKNRKYTVQNNKRNTDSRFWWRRKQNRKRKGEKKVNIYIHASTQQRNIL